MLLQQPFFLSLNTSRPSEALVSSPKQWDTVLCPGSSPAGDVFSFSGPQMSRHHPLRGTDYNQRPPPSHTSITLVIDGTVDVSEVFVVEPSKSRVAPSAVVTSVGCSPRPSVLTVSNPPTFLRHPKSGSI